MDRRQFLRGTVGAAAGVALAPLLPSPAKAIEVSTEYNMATGRIEWWIPTPPDPFGEVAARIGRDAARQQSEMFCEMFWQAFTADDANFTANPYEALERKRLT